MTLRELSSIVGVSIAELSRIERGLAPHVAYEDLVGIGSGLALDVPLRTFPNGIRSEMRRRWSCFVASASSFRPVFGSGTRFRSGSSEINAPGTR